MNAPNSRLLPAKSAPFGIHSSILVDAAWLSVRSIKREPCTFCIGCSAVCLVVTVCALVMTLISVAPLIFLREAESAAGQVDVLLSADASVGGGAVFLNYSQLSATLAATRGLSSSPSASISGPTSSLDVTADAYSYHAPRSVLAASSWPAAACSLPPGASLSDGSVGRRSNAWMYAQRGETVAALRAVAQPIASSYGVEILTQPVERGYVPSDCGFKSCMPAHCAPTPAFSLSLILIDTAREARMGYGRAWEHDSAIPPGEVILHAAAASALRVKSGDFIFVSVTEPSLMRYAFARGVPNATRIGWADMARVFSELVLPLRVAAVVSSSRGKWPLSDGAIAFAELSSFIPYALPRMHPRLTSAAFESRGGLARGVASVIPLELRDVLPPSALDYSAANPASGAAYEYAGQVAFNLPPAARIPAYTNANYDRVRAAVADFASNMLYIAGFTESTSTLALLASLETRRFVSLYLGLVLDILLIILFALACILIYSLLLVNVESRGFEMAVRRMIGARRSGILILLLAHAGTYALPAWITGLVLAQLAALGVLRAFTLVSSIPVSVLLTPEAVGTATVLAFAIPGVAAVGPIRGALKSNIAEALDADRRPSASPVVLQVERANDGRVNRSLVIIGILMSLFGFGIYYLLPLSLLSLNLALFLNLFLAILVGMLAGFILLSLNIELLLLRANAALWVQWWESPAVFSLLWSNMSTAHRVRNRKTSLMYSLSLAFIVFIAVIAQTQIQSASFAAQAAQGAPLTVAVASAAALLVPPDPAAVAAVEDIVRRTPWVTGAAWSTGRLAQTLAFVSVAGVAPSGSDTSQRAAAPVTVGGMVLRPIGRTAALTGSPVGVGSRFFDGATYAQFLAVESGPTVAETAAPLSTQLYTTRGSGGMIASNSMYWELWIARGSHALLEGTTTLGVLSGANGTTAYGAGRYTRSRFSVMAMVSSTPAFVFARGPSIFANTVLVSLPQFARIVDAQLTRRGTARINAQATAARAWHEQLLARLSAAAVSSTSCPGAQQTLRAIAMQPVVAAINVTAARQGDTLLAAARAYARTGVGLSATAASDALALPVVLTPGCLCDANLAVACALLPLVTDAARTYAYTTGSTTAAIGSFAAVSVAGSTQDAGVATAPSLRSINTAVSMDDLLMRTLYIGFDDAAVSPSTVTALEARITAALNGITAARAADGIDVTPVLSARATSSTWTQADMASVGADTAITLTLLQLFFAVIALVALCLCFFALLASSRRAVREGVKSIAMLRSIGLSRAAIVRLYTCEAALLVLSSCETGIVIGAATAWTFSAQQSLFTALPLPFEVPWGIIVLVCLASLGAALAAAGVPAHAAARTGITTLMRGGGTGALAA